jgi:uridine phosphorylase
MTPAPEPNLHAYGPPPAPGRHLHPTCALAPRALLPDDPGVALALAQTLLTRPLMFNHHRGLWGYTGMAADGVLLTIQSTGIGGPSTAIILQELIDVGLRRAVRVGLGRALDPSLPPGRLLIAGTALALDGTSRALGASRRVDADPGLTRAIVRAARDADVPAELVVVASTDLFYDPDPDLELGRADAWRAAGARAVELETATVLQLGVHRRIDVGCALVVDGGEPADLLAAVATLGAVAASALADA